MERNLKNILYSQNVTDKLIMIIVVSMSLTAIKTNHFSLSFLLRIIGSNA